MSSPQNGLVAGNKQNEAGGVSLRNRSRFPLSYSFYNTERFAEYTPFFVEEGISGDTLPLHSHHEIRTYTLKSPLMQSLLKKKDFFYVPMQAILPKNWEKFYTNPVIGEDVPEDSGCGVADFWAQVATAFNQDFSASVLFESGLSNAQIVHRVLKCFLFYEYFYSTGSLLETLGISGHTHIRCFNDNLNLECTYDDIFDAVFTELFDVCSEIRLTIGDDVYVASADLRTDTSDGVYFVNYRQLLELLRDDLTFTVNSVTLDDGASLTSVKTIMQHYSCVVDDSDPVPLNLGRLWAYQLVCAHFYTNDHVDFIYSAELFRQYIWQLFTEHTENNYNFSVNGFFYDYDALSAYVCSDFLYNLNIISSDNSVFAYFTALLHFKRSLRFMDYFTGGRKAPLAVGDTAVDASSGQVNILDLAQKRMLTKFLNAVNRSGRKFGAYMKELFGIIPKPDYHNPFYLAHTSDVVGSNETNSTAENQFEMNAISSNLMNNSDRYAFEFQPDRDCIVIGLSYYDIPRVYSRATERQNFVLDRFDMFNPYLQYVGDQPIYKAEIGSGLSMLPFAYTNRDMQYKQRYNQCAGGFVQKSTQLQTWLFIADEQYRQNAVYISSNFIRSYNSELDKFYASLTGWSNGTYFHFICRYDNRQDASRPMAYAPTIE